MKVIYARGQAIRFKTTSVAIGIFDGMHRGHQYLLNKMLKTARVLKAKSLVITFFPHPAHVLRPDLKLGYLTSLDQRLRWMADLGVDVCLVIPFNKEFARIEPAAFIRNTLVKDLGAKAVFVGEDFRFGKDRLGDTTLFKQLGAECGFQMHAVRSLRSGTDPISSTRIRRMVLEGDLKSAKLLLGRPFAVEGKVVKGQGRGKGLGFPTANVAYVSDILPPNGVYAVRVIHRGESLKGVCNLGIVPTFKVKNLNPQLEVYLFGSKKNRYGQEWQVSFIKKIRNEQKFASSDQLIAQIKKDVLRAQTILK